MIGYRLYRNDDCAPTLPIGYSCYKPVIRLAHHLPDGYNGGSDNSSLSSLGIDLTFESYDVILHTRSLPLKQPVGWQRPERVSVL